MNYEYNVDKSLKLVYYDSDNDGVQDANEQFNRYNYDSKGNLVSVAHNGTEYTFAYNEWGQRTSAAAGSNTLATYTYPVVNDKAINATITGMTFGGDSTKSQEYIYDELGNKTGRKFGGTLTQEWEYDNKGNLVSEKDYEDDTNAWYQYDAKSRLSRSYKYYEELYYIASSYAYDKNSNLSQVSHYINGSPTTNTSYAYDEDGRFTTATSGSVRAETAYNEVTDKLTTRSVSTVGANDNTTLITSETYSYYTSNSISSVKDAVKEISYNDNSKISYTYDSQGRIKTESRNGTLYVTYTYDKLGQLTEALYSTLGQTHTFNYDNAGNITKKITKQGYQILSSSTYSYGNETWSDLLTSNGQYSTLYDSMGNPIEYTKQADGIAPIDNAYLVWENGRELASINSKATNTPIASYKYNSSGLRTYKSSGVTGDVRYLYDDNGNLISEQRGDCALTYYYDGNGVRTHFTRQGEDGTHTYYYRYNLQGDVIALLDSTGTVVAEYNYTPYGEHIGTVTGIAAYNPFRYRGYYFDSETGYYYLQSRYYNPYTCRFINSDAILNIDFGGSNLFGYCNNDPVNYVDPTGYLFLADDAILVLGIFTFTAIAIICIGWQAQLSWSSFVDGTGALQYDYYKDEPDLEIHHNPNSNQSPSTILDVVPAPDTSTKDKKQKKFVFFEAHLMKPGVSVLLEESMGLEEAISWVLDGNNVWTMHEEDAIFLAICASGGYVSGNDEGLVVSGENAFHYHLKSRYKGAHIFYGYQAVEFYFGC